MKTYNYGVHDLPKNISLHSNILPHKAVMTTSLKLADVGDFVKVSSLQVDIIIITVVFIVMCR